MGSLEWSCFVLDYLLRDGPEVVARGALHSTHMFDTMVQYLRAKGASYKHKIVGLLTQLLKARVCARVCVWGGGGRRPHLLPHCVWLGVL
jgi:hypothetical protein